MVNMTTHSASSMKTCFKCGVSQPRSNFYPLSKMSDGLLGKCKECTKKDVAEYRKKNVNRIRLYNIERRKTPEYRLLAQLWAIERRKNHEHRLLAASYVKRWREEDPRRTIAHRAVAKAIRNGTITKIACIVCGSLKSEAHHESYDRPLDVVWYCRIHHFERHQKMLIEGVTP